MFWVGYFGEMTRPVAPIERASVKLQTGVGRQDQVNAR